MTMMTRLLGGATAAAALLSMPLAAFAHVSLEVGEAPANSTYKAIFRVPHGCDGQATRTFTVVLPEGFIDAKPMPKAGWTLETVKAPFAKTYTLWGDQVSEGVTEVRWSDGSLDDGHYDEFVVRGRVTGFAPGTQLPFKAVQTCADGEVAWTEVAAPGADPHDLAHPAPVLTVAAGAKADHAGHAGHEAPGAVPAEATVGDLTVATAWMRQPPPGANVAGAYVTVTNAGDSADRLMGGTVPFADRFEVHEMKMADGVMTMAEVDGGLEIPAGSTVALTPGGYHIMLMGLGDAPNKGVAVPLTLTFEKAGTIEVMMTVAPMGAAAPTPAANHSGANHGGASHSTHKN
ncbi:DUF1775 domain-containing protein [Acuticoccus sp. I52.16.1]|uniref:DUF1775 domain-containing protein n=1 Tax=Acuticoccus sp. I52.16.1 TaxID=2928472 RepID=UPI001FD1BA85|nr:DUF1775 domain-containing protein [Acuticoccus sp. I52.16.1]UOM32675.1 DUF1775 domain-containing protein [Acuticoccus sp. I52.16.1]